MEHVIATIADINNVEAAKQLFSSVYFNAGWKGDLLLISHDIPENQLSWFKKRKIYISKCKPLLTNKLDALRSVYASRIYLFQTKMKKWQTVIYLDTDIIVKSSLDRLTKINEFAAVKEYEGGNISNLMNLDDKESQIIRNKFENFLGQRINANDEFFNSGVLVINTQIINNETFSKLIKLLEIIYPICIYLDQALLNLFFYRKWKELPKVYNLHPLEFIRRFGFSKKEIKSVILHFSGVIQNYKPWNKDNIYYSEWSNNYNEAKNINKVKNNKPKSDWSSFKIWFYNKYYYYIFLKYTFIKI